MAASISVPSSVNLGTVVVGNSKSVQMGTVTVTGQGQTTWTATVNASAFVRAGGGGAIGAGNFTYWSGPATSSSGPGLCTPGQATAAQAASLSASRTAFRRTGSAGNNACSWNPTVTISVPSTAEAGTYTGTLGHSAL